MLHKIDMWNSGICKLCFKKIKKSTGQTRDQEHSRDQQHCLGARHSKSQSILWSGETFVGLTKHPLIEWYKKVAWSFTSSLKHLLMVKCLICMCQNQSLVINSKHSCLSKSLIKIHWKLASPEEVGGSH